MKKMMKRIGSVLLAVAMMAALGVTGAFGVDADTDQHTITITNTDQNVAHTYEAYKVFSGSLDAKEEKLSNIEWANGVNSAALLPALKANTVDASLKVTADGTDAIGNAITAGQSIFVNCNTAQDVARTIQKYLQDTSGVTDSAAGLDALASIIAKNLGTKAADFDADDNDATKYTATVYGDGYYFIKDTTTKLTSDTTTGSDTLSKFILKVIKDETIVAKDTGIVPDKEIVGGATHVKAGSLSVGDTANFEVTVDVPNTTKYEDHFIFNMVDQLPTGITFTGISSVKIYQDTTQKAELADVKGATGVDFNDADWLAAYDGGTGYYALDVTNADNTTNNYAWTVNGFDPVNAAGGQKITLTFKEFKKFVEKKEFVNKGMKVVVTYTGVVNDKADFTATGNKNEVEFVYSNNPDHDYNGDNPGTEDPVGVTPKSTTIHYTTSVKVLKVDENNNPLSGATFKLSGNAMNRTVLTGYRFVETSYTPKNGETIDSTANYWKLKDGSYTTTDPNSGNINKTQYESTTKKYFKVTYNKVEEAAKSTASEIVTEDNGVAEYIGLNGGDYTLEETASADGYNKIDGQLNFKIHWSDPEGNAPTGMSDEAWNNAKKSGGYWIEKLDTSSDAWANLEWNETDKQFTITVVNKSGSTLPSTGGIGTYVFTIAGVAIMAIAAGLLVIRHKKKAE